MSDIYVQYAATESEELKPLRIFAKVPRAKIHEYQQVSDDPTLSDEDICQEIISPVGREPSWTATRLLD